MRYEEVQRGERRSLSSARDTQGRRSVTTSAAQARRSVQASGKTRNYASSGNVSSSTRTSGSSTRASGISTRMATRASGSSTRTTTRSSVSSSGNRTRTAGTTSAELRRKKQATAKQNARKRKGRLAIWLIVEALILAAAVAVIFMLDKMDKVQKPSWGKVSISHNEEIEEQIIQHMAAGYEDIMIFGVDARSSWGQYSLETGTGADVNILAHIDKDSGEVKLVSFFRDMALRDDYGSYRKLTDIYRADGPLGALNAINRTLDLNVTEYVTVNWAGAATAVEMLGGVEIDVPEEMIPELNGYLTETVEETGIGSYQVYSPGFQHLNGVQTVAWCRIRHVTLEGYDYGDFGRAERQREVLGLLLDKAKNMSLGELNGIADYMLTQVSTNLDLLDILDLGSRMGKYYMTDSVGFPYEKGSPDYEIVLAYDLEDNVLRLHQELYGFDDGYQVSNTVKNISYYFYTTYGF